MFASRNTRNSSSGLSPFIPSSATPALSPSLAILGQTSNLRDSFEIILMTLVFSCGQNTWKPGPDIPFLSLSSFPPAPDIFAVVIWTPHSFVFFLHSATQLSLELLAVSLWGSNEIHSLSCGSPWWFSTRLSLTRFPFGLSARCHVIASASSLCATRPAFKGHPQLKSSTQGRKTDLRTSRPTLPYLTLTLSIKNGPKRQLLMSETKIFSAINLFLDSLCASPPVQRCPGALNLSKPRLWATHIHPTSILGDICDQFFTLKNLDFSMTLLNTFLKCFPQIPKTELRGLWPTLPYEVVSRHLPVGAPCPLSSVVVTSCTSEVCRTLIYWTIHVLTVN